jgi:hypothetical protein
MDSEFLSGVQAKVMKRLFALIVLSLLIGACAPSEIPKTQKLHLNSNLRTGPLGIGVNIHLDRDPLVARVHDLGAHWVRMDINWDDIEPKKGIWNFTQTDRSITDSCSEGLLIYATLAYSPAWASSSHSPTAVPDSASWKEFVDVVARRYEGEVSVYGIWNEPNLEEFWSGTAEEYTNVLLKPAYEAIKAVDPSVKVAGPELAHLYSARLGIQEFLDGVRDAGGDPYIDIVSHHIYGMDDFQQKVLGFSLFNIQYKAGLREMLEQAGLGDKAVWITETGVDAKAWGESEQARRLKTQLEFLETQDWIQNVFIYELSSVVNEGPHWGLLRADLSSRPAFLSIQKFIKEEKGEVLENSASKRKF